MNKILLIVEGADKESEFFNCYKKKKKAENIEVVSFNQNIQFLYKKCRKYIINGIKPNNLIDILKDSNVRKNDLKKLEQKYTDVFLIFDLDLQNCTSNRKITWYLKKIRSLIDFFNDSTTIGQILINYPMMESICHIDDKNFNSFKEISIYADVVVSKSYCDYLNSLKMNFSFKLLKSYDFNILAAYNLMKANYIVNGKYEPPTKYDYEYNLTQENIFEKQKEYIKEGKMFVLNCSTFIDIDLFGKKLYFNEHNKNIFESKDEFLKDKVKRINKFKE